MKSVYLLSIILAFSLCSCSKGGYPTVNTAGGGQEQKSRKKYKLNSPVSKKYKKKKVSYYKNRRPKRLGLLRR